MHSEGRLTMTTLELMLIVVSYLVTAGAGAFFGARLTEEYIRRYYK